MVKKINKVGLGMVLLPFVILLWGLNQGFTQDWSTILKQAKAKYAKFEKEVKDMTIVQEMKTGTGKEEVITGIKIFRKGEKFRVETKTQMAQVPEMPEGMGGMETAVIYDGKDYWMVSPFMGKKKLSPEETKGFQKEKEWWKLVSEKGRIVGAEKVDNRECYVVELEEGKESPFNQVWIDKKSLDLIKAESKGSEGETITWVFSDFNKIKDDWEMAHKMEMYAEGELTMSTLVKSVEINTGLSDDLFTPPEVKEEKKKGPGVPGMMKRMLLEKMKEKGEEKMEEKIDETIDETLGD
jgi:outer membrane lipoprotein-sorting protein